MAKYQINVTRIGYACRVIEVEAKSQEEAENLALEKAPNLEFSEHASEYEIS